MANGKKQKAKVDEKLKVLDTILIVSMATTCFVALLLAIIVLVLNVGGWINLISATVTVCASVAVITLIADIILGRNPGNSVREIIEESGAVDEMSGIQFENYVAEKLIDAGWDNVELTPASGDHGVDVLGTNAGVRYAIQCKRYKSSVDTKAIQEVYTGCRVYGADRAVVVTNSTFTRQAKEMAEKLDVELWSIEKLESWGENGE